MEEKRLKISDLKEFENVSKKVLEVYDVLGFVEKIEKREDGFINVHCEMGFLSINEEGYERALATNEDNPFIYW